MIELHVEDAPSAVLQPDQAQVIRAVSPTIDAERTDEGALLTIHDIDGEKTITVYDGEQGEQGEPGQDGVSPTVTVQAITGGHRITITDAGGTSTVDVMDGADGDDGRGIASIAKTGTSGLVDTYTITYTDGTTSTFAVTNGQKGDPGDDGVTFTPTVSAEGVISWSNDGGRTNPQPVDIKGPKGDTGEKGDPGEVTQAEFDTLSESVGDLESAIDTLPPIKESDAEDVDLDISDPDGNVIMRLADGHIKVKNFDSESVADLEEAVTDIQSATNKSPIVKNSSAVGVDLDVSDNAGNVIIRLQNGHIKVKNFDSSELNATISGIEEDILEIEEAITPSVPTSVTVDSVSDLLDEIANGETDVILIKNGTYNVLNVEVTRNVQIIGESRTGVFLTCDGTTDQVNPVTDRHGIRFQKGGVLKNLTFNVNDVKYVMHQDNISVSYDLLVENCTFNRYDDSCGYYFFIGCGCYGTQNITVKNCSFIFSENTHNRVSYGIYWHNWHLAKSQLNALAANVTMENCGCVGCGMINVQDLASKEVNDIISVLNCCSTEAAPVSSGANGYYIGVPNADVPYNVLFIINNKIGNMILQDRSADEYAYLGASVTNFTT